MNGGDGVHDEANWLLPLSHRNSAEGIIGISRHDLLIQAKSGLDDLDDLRPLHHRANACIPTCKCLFLWSQHFEPPGPAGLDTPFFLQNSDLTCGYRVRPHSSIHCSCRGRVSDYTRDSRRSYWGGAGRERR